MIDRVTGMRRTVPKPQLLVKMIVCCSWALTAAMTAKAMRTEERRVSRNMIGLYCRGVDKKGQRKLLKGVGANTASIYIRLNIFG